MNLTPEQQKVIEAAKTERAISVEAYAGSGKTALLVEIAKSQPKNTFMCLAFNKKNALDFQQRLPKNATGSTAHSFAYKFLKKGKGFKVDTSGYKVFNIIFSDPDYNFKEESLSKEESMVMRENVNGMKQLVSLCKNYFIDPKAVDVIQLVDHFAIPFSLPLDQIASDCIRFLAESDKNINWPDYDDMIRFPVISKTIRPSFGFFCIDESQDNSPIRTVMFQQMLESGCQVLNVGDKFQSINGWCGADVDAMGNIQKAVNSIVLPLTVNFRCAKSIITEAQKIVPQIQAWEGSPEGEIVYGNSELFEKDFKTGECALARMNRTIIPYCFKFIKKGIKANVIGRDFGKALISQIKDMKATSIDDFYVRLDKWQERQLKNCKSDSIAEAINDRFECLKFFADNSDTVEGIEKTIEGIFSEENAEGLMFSTIHRSKGGQWPSVFILDSNNLMSSRPNEKPWQIQQTRNLAYVAETRPQQKLAYIN